MSDKTAGSKNVRNQVKALASSYGKNISRGVGQTQAQQYGTHRHRAKLHGSFSKDPSSLSSWDGRAERDMSKKVLESITKKAEERAPMDRELAGVVIEKWENGEAVSEKQLYKAAAALGIDPMAALVEARFYTYLDDYLLEKRAMSKAERAVFSAAAGMSSGVMEKTASAHGFSPDELIVEALRSRNFVPAVEKIANLALMMQQGGQGQPKGQGQGQPPGAQPPMEEDPAAMGGQAMMAPPQDGAMLQQQPSARFKPSPTAPEQVAASPMGNLDELIQQGQQVFGQQAMDNGGVAPQGMPEPAPPAPSPEERIRQVGPNLDDETVARYAEQLTRFEEGFQMQISDPKQMVKFVKELQKVDGKKIDQGIKAMGQQLEQEQAQELGVDATPTIDGPGGAGAGGPGKAMAPKAPPPGGEEAAGGPPPQESAPQGGPAQAKSEAGDIPGAGAQPPQGGSPTQPPKKAPPQQAAQAAVEKVAHAARVLARASIR